MLRSLRGITLAVVAGLVAGCAAHTPFRCPTKGGAPWREITTPGFVVQTDLPSDEARELAEELEHLNQTLVTALLRRPPTFASRLEVVVFRNAREYADFAPTSDTIAFYLSTQAGDEVVVMAGALDLASRVTIVHELTHRVLARVFLRQPRWFGEGMAVFMESLGKASWRSRPRIGGIPPRIERGEAYLRAPVQQTLLTERPTARDYPTAWALVHLLHNRYPAEFGVLQQRFARGDDPRVAWREVFPQWDPSDPEHMQSLDRELARHLDGGRYAYRLIELPEAPVALSERPLSPADAHGVRLRLLTLMKGPRERHEVELDEALAEDPSNVRVLEVAARHRPARAVELARRASAAHPDDPRAWDFLAGALEVGDAKEREDALRRVIALDPGRAGALGELAASHLDRGEFAEALPLAEKAVAYAPWSSPAHVVLGSTLVGLGRCDEGLRALRRGVDVVPESAPDYLTRVHAMREQAEAQCALPTPPAAPAVAPASAPVKAKPARNRAR